MIGGKGVGEQIMNNMNTLPPTPAPSQSWLLPCIGIGKIIKNSNIYKPVKLYKNQKMKPALSLNPSTFDKRLNFLNLTLQNLKLFSMNSQKFVRIKKIRWELINQSTAKSSVGKCAYRHLHNLFNKWYRFKLLLTLFVNFSHFCLPRLLKLDLRINFMNFWWHSQQFFSSAKFLAVSLPSPLIQTEFIFQ